MTTIQTIQSVPTPMPRASISTTTGEHPDDMALGVDATPDDEPGEDGPVPKSLIRLYQWATARGDISDLLSDGEVERLGADAIRQWESDSGTRSRWVEDAERFLSLAAQEGSNEDGP